MGQRTIRTCDRCSRDIEAGDEDACTPQLCSIRGIAETSTDGPELCGPCVASLRYWWAKLDHLCDRPKQYLGREVDRARTPAGVHPNPPAASPDGAATDSTG